jgi:FKBP-type peptidyl-prolyl cis-trans isomerase SlyD
MPREELQRKVKREDFPDEVDPKPGMAFRVSGPQGNMPFMVKEVNGDEVTIDFNHPLCGERLHFDVKVVEVREATEQELAAAQSCEPGSCDDHDHGPSCDGCGHVH